MCLIHLQLETLHFQLLQLKNTLFLEASLKKKKKLSCLNIDGLPVIVNVVVFTRIVTVESCESWYEMTYVRSVLPANDSGGSQLKVMVELVVDTTIRFLGAEGGPAGA